MMENLITLNSRQVKNIMNTLKQQFGYVGDLKEFAFFLKKKDASIKLITRDIEKTMHKRLNIDSLGLRIGKEIADGILLTIEGAQLIGKDCNKNIVELDHKQMRSWLKGFDIETEDMENKFVLLKHEDDFLGSGKMKDARIINNIPKPRRLMASD